MLTEDVIDGLIELTGVLRPMYDDAVLLGIGSKQVEILVEVGDGMALDGAGLLAQLLPLVKPLCHVVALRTH